MQAYQKNIYLLIVKIPYIIMSVLMLIVLVLVAKLQHNELILNFDSQCKQYDTSVNLFLSKIHSKASLITQNPQVVDNLEIQNYPVIQDSLLLLYSSSYGEIIHAYIVNSKNEKLWRSQNISEHEPINFDDIQQYGQITLLYSQHKDFSNGIFSLIYPIHDSNGSISGGLIIYFEANLLLKNIPYDTENPPLITLESSKYSHNYAGNANFPFLYVKENRITVPGNNVNITLKASIVPIIKTVISLLILFLLILAVFIFILRFFAYCVNQSINQPIKEIQEKIQNYTSSVTQTRNSGSDNDE